MNSIPEKSTHPLRVSECFPDVSVLGQAVGFNLRFRQLDNSGSAIPATVLLGKNVALTHMRFSSGYHQLGLPPKNMLTFGVPVSGFRDWFGCEYRQSSILPFNQPGGIDGVSEKGFEAFTLSFSEGYMADIAGSYGIPVPEYLYRPKPESRIDRGEFNYRLRSLLGRLFSDPDSVFTQGRQEELVVTLLNAARNDFADVDRSSARLRTRKLEKVLTYIENHRDQAVSVRDICSANDVALRTLNRAFNERFGIGPKAYLNRRRLSAVRGDILRSPPGTLLTSIANRWGFWHMGQFANDYRKLFGELPSQTNAKI